MRTSVILTGLVLSAAVATGCGEDAPEEQAARAPSVNLAERQAQLDQDPYDLRCADLADKVASAGLTRRVQYALADDAQIPGSIGCASRRASSSPSPRSARASRGHTSRPPGHRRGAKRRVRRRPRIALIGHPSPDRLGLHPHGGRAHQKGRGAAARAAVPRGRPREWTGAAHRWRGRRRQDVCGRRRWAARRRRACA